MPGLTIVLLCSGLSAQSTAAQQESDILSSKDYLEYLAALDKSDFGAFQLAVARYQSDCSSLPIAQRDTAFHYFKTFFFGIISYHNDRIWEDLDFLGQLHVDEAERPDTIRTFVSELQANGLQLYTFEGLYYIDQQPDFLYREFASHVSPPVAEYLRLRSMELEQGFADEGRLKISFEELGERVIHWEQFRASQPLSVVSGEADYYHHLYHDTFFTGTTGNPIFMSDSRIQPDVRRLYLIFVRKYPASAAGDLMQQFLDVLESVDYRWSYPVKSFYVQHKIRNMHVATLPYR